MKPKPMKKMCMKVEELSLNNNVHDLTRRTRTQVNGRRNFNKFQTLHWDQKGKLTTRKPAKTKVRWLFRAFCWLGHNQTTTQRPHFGAVVVDFCGRSSRLVVNWTQPLLALFNTERAPTTVTALSLYIAQRHLLSNAVEPCPCTAQRHLGRLKEISTTPHVISARCFPYAASGSDARAVPILIFVPTATARTAASTSRARAPRTLCKQSTGANPWPCRRPTQRPWRVGSRELHRPSRGRNCSGSWKHEA